MMKRIVLFLFCVGYIWGGVALAHGGGCACSAVNGVSVGGPILTIPAYNMSKGAASLGFGTSYANYGRLSSNQVNKLLREDEHGDDVNSVLSPTLFGSYGVTDKLSVMAAFPFRIGFDYHEVHDGFEEQGNSIGFGDLTLLSKYTYLNRKTFQSAIIAGIKLPTGASHVIADTGERFEAKNQPGSGSFDPLMGLAFSKQFGKFGFDTSAIYKLATEGAQNTDAGDSVNLGLGLTYALNHEHKNHFHHKHDHNENQTFLQKVFPEHVLGQHLTWDLILESISSWEAKPTIDGVEDTGHGGFTVSVYPGLRVAVNDSVVCNLSVGMPVMQFLHGEQGGSDFQIFFGMATAL